MGKSSSNRKNKIKVQFEGFDTYVKKLEELAGGKAVKRALENALEESQHIVAEKTIAAMEPHNKTGDTAGAIIVSDPPHWSGSVASINVGFDINEGGFPSIYLMYGTKLHGEPHITPDRDLYNAVYGTATKKKIKEVQKDAFERALIGVMKK